MRSPQERRRSSASHWLRGDAPLTWAIGVEEDVEAPLRDHPRVEALHRARRGVARVGERLLLRLLPLAVDRLEAAAGQVHLARAPRAPPARPSPWSTRGIARMALAFGVTSSPRTPSPAGDRPDEPPALVVERHRQPVDLQLRGVGDLPLPHRPEDALLELPQLLLGVGVVEAQHRHPVGEARELLRGLARPRAGWGCRG